MSTTKHFRKVVNLRAPEGLERIKVDAAIKKVSQMHKEGKLPKAAKIKPIRFC